MELPETVEQVYNIFKGFFTEDAVDISKNANNNYDILIYYPKVFIENENNKKHLLRDLFVKVTLKGTGHLACQFTLTRATFTNIEVNYNYLHSHVNGLSSDLSEFRISCLGRGPIYNTIETLKTDNFDEDMWKLFCLELDRYIKTESIKGIPYRYISRLQGDSSVYKCQYEKDTYASARTSELLNDFIKYVMQQNALIFKWDVNKYNIAISNYSLHLLLTKYYLEFCKLTCRETSELKNYCIKNDCIYTVGSEEYHNLDITNKYVCTFKGKDFVGKVIQEDNNYPKLLAEDIVIECKNLITLFYNYEQRDDKTTGKVYLI